DPAQPRARRRLRGDARDRGVQHQRRARVGVAGGRSRRRGADRRLRRTPPPDPGSGPGGPGRHRSRIGRCRRGHGAATRAGWPGFRPVPDPHRSRGTRRPRRTGAGEPGRRARRAVLAVEHGRPDRPAGLDRR
ncbi:MAG: hypothetical protein AVDCRST_MAG41-2906, partial [uncultured Corynebacteriales bacterium]